MDDTRQRGVEMTSTVWLARDPHPAPRLGTLSAPARQTKSRGSVAPNIPPPPVCCTVPDSCAPPSTQPVLLH
jgi:hypothetical protein